MHNQHRRQMNKRIVIGLLVFVAGCSGPQRLVNVDALSAEEAGMIAEERFTIALNGCLDRSETCGFRLDPGSKTDTVKVDQVKHQIHAELNDAFGQQAFREETINMFEQVVRRALGEAFQDYDLKMSAMGIPLKDLVPNVYRSGDRDVSRMPASPDEKARLTTDLSKLWRADAQLSGRHIAIWPSHGWYYETRLDRWEWQRARLFQTVEDLFPMSFVVPYLMPMLEGAGAYVHIPRERDVQTHEVVVDFDSEKAESNRYLEIGEKDFAWKKAEKPGYRHFESLGAVNPFEEGTYRVSTTDTVSSAMVSWNPDFAATGRYAVYVAFGKEEEATRDARYTVHHLGGATTISVNQQMAGGTWVYLGHFDFMKGSRPESGRVELSNVSSDPGKIISADVVRFGGGMGSVERGGMTSGRPRFTEGARYYMQFAGMPDALVYNVTEDLNDYVDDYRGRAEWVNYLVGAPFGPNKNRDQVGLNVPVDLSLAFHTDAGITQNERTIGTLMIYSSTGAVGDKTFPDGQSRVANRDLGDIMQTTIVDDLRAKYDPNWNRRAIWDRDYSEAVRPNVPGVLLELLSHQNFADMKFGLDPRFRFDVARSVYKSMAYFLADQHGYEPVIQPLPVSHLRTEWIDSGKLKVSWEAVMDPLESSAAPDAYVVYVARDEGSYAPGQWVRENHFVLDEIEAGVVYRFRVAGVNAGGESMPSEEVAAGQPFGAQEGPTVMVIAGFDRISAPAVLEYGSFRGFADFEDEGVADGMDLSYVGRQYDFDSQSPWLDDDAPGHGASYSTQETQVLTGNTFNYPAIHGDAILASGYSFATSSDEAIEEGLVRLEAYPFVDLILGEEKTTTGPGMLTDFQAVSPEMQKMLMDYSGAVIVTGAHVASDLAGPGASEEAKDFAEDRLSFTWRTDHAVEVGHTYGIGAFENLGEIWFNTDPTADIYRVESPDALEPAEGAQILLRYGDNNMSAMIGRSGTSGVIVAGFPFETVIGGRSVRIELMQSMLNYLSNN